MTKTKRLDLENRAFNILRSDMQNIHVSDAQLKKEIKNASDSTLIIFICESEDENE